MTGGSTDRYLRILKAYYEDGIEKINELNTCLETNDIPLFTIYSHAIKSSSANIGADKLSQAA
jgi:HPt (histidine-containing phosphotransfer) domain-containing protein